MSRESILKNMGWENNVGRGLEKNKKILIGVLTLAGPTGLVISPTGPREHQGVTGVRLINQPYPAEVIPLLKKE